MVFPAAVEQFPVGAVFDDPAGVTVAKLLVLAGLCKSNSDGRRLIQGGAVGRRLDFIAQEMNREANTTLSKTTDAEISDMAIELKTEIEKVREQIQNIE